MKIAVVGATGLVGREMIRVLEETDIPVSLFIPAASERSAGKVLSFRGQEFKVMSVEKAVSLHPDISLFSAGAAASLQWAQEFANAGSFVIDNSSAWRMFDQVPLVVPEINAHLLNAEHKIIANPNCSTIQLVLVLAPLHRLYIIDRVVVSTYQSVTGSGIRAVRQLENERKGLTGEMAYPHPIDLNLFPHGGSFTPNGYTSEEVKLVNETRKILASPSIRLTATVVRVPVFGGHSEAVNVAFEKDFEIRKIREILENTSGVEVLDDPENNIYPMPLYASGKNEVFVGRIRRDESNPRTLDMFIVADNLRKGAATNAVQIAESLFRNNLAGTP